MAQVRSTASVVAAAWLAGAAFAAGPKNVVLMVGDGAGYNAWLATRMYRGSAAIQEGEGWLHLAVATHALRQSVAPPAGADPLAQVEALVYDPARAWDGTPIPPSGRAGEYPLPFEGYRWLRDTAPDSASTATALATGRSTAKRAINVDGAGRPIEDTIVAIAERAGKATGIVTTVPFNHATPAALGGAHASSRRAYCPIAIELLTGPLDVIAGAGHPDFDNNGRPLGDRPRNFDAVGGENVWRFLERKGTLTAGDAACAPSAEARRFSADEVRALASWKLHTGRAEIERLRTGSTPGKTLIVPRAGQAAFARPGAVAPSDVRWVGGTLQQERGSRADPRFTAPGDDPPIDTVPDLAALTRAALNALDDDVDGFFLHVEGGAIDWAMHANQLGRVIEETLDFQHAIDAVAAWVETHGGWEGTLVIVTADHDLMLWGPRADEVPFDPLGDRGAGRLPAHRWLSDDHSNALVPLWARGAGADRLLGRERGVDPRRGPYVHQTDVFEAMRLAMEPRPAAVRRTGEKADPGG
jgi:alkaline phosphatase